MSFPFNSTLFIQHPFTETQQQWQENRSFMVETLSRTRAVWEDPPPDGQIGKGGGGVLAFFNVYVPVRTDERLSARFLSNVAWTHQVGEITQPRLHDSGGCDGMEKIRSHFYFLARH